MVTAQYVEALRLAEELDFEQKMLAFHRKFHDVWCMKKPGCMKQAAHYAAAMRARERIAEIVAQRVK